MGDWVKVAGRDIGTQDYVAALQDQVVTQTVGIYDQMKQVYQGALGRSMQDIDASFTFSPGPVDAEGFSAAPTLAAAITALDGLSKKLLVSRPNYPTFNESVPSLPYLDTNPPGVSDIVIPDAPNIVSPTFDAVLEDEEVLLPEVSFDYSELLYSSGLHDALYNLLLDEISNGGYGINDDDESRLFARAREREQKVLQANIDGAVRLHSLGGFSMPTGSAFAAIQRAQSEAMEKISSINRDLMVQRSELYLKGKELNQNATLSMEKQDSDLWNSKQDRALKAAAQEVTSILEISAFQIERLKLFMEKYKTLALVFETEAKVEMTKVDIYKAQIDAVDAQVKIDMALIEEFVARNKAIVDVFLAQVEEYKAQMDGYVKYIGALSDQYKADAAMYSAVADGYGKAFDIETSVYKSDSDYESSLANAKVNMEKIKFDVEAQNAQLALEGEKAEAQMAAMVVSAALSAMNINASLGATSSASTSFNGSVSDSESVATNYNIEA